MQRDATRRIRRVTAVTAAAVVAMLIMAALTVFAIDARREAERQRAKSEGLVEFMLTDLSEKLRGVGRIEIMAAVDERALAHYDPADAADPIASRAMRARVMQGLVEIDLARSNERAAIARLRDAYRMTSALIAEAPNDPHAIFAHGQSEYWLGRIYEERAQWEPAGRHYARYQDAARRLIRIAPANPDYMVEMAWSASNWGLVLQNCDHDNQAARRSFLLSASWFQRAIAVRPRDSDQRDLANVYANLADAYYDDLLYRASLGVRLRQYRILEPLLRRDPGNLESAYRVAGVERAIGLLSDRVGERADVLPFLRKAHLRMQRLVAHDPSNSEWVLLLAKTECSLLEQTSVHPGVQEEPMRGSVLRAADTLAARGYPLISQISLCLARLHAPGARPRL